MLPLIYNRIHHQSGGQSVLQEDRESSTSKILHIEVWSANFVRHSGADWATDFFDALRKIHLLQNYKFVYFVKYYPAAALPLAAAAAAVVVCSEHVQLPPLALISIHRVTSKFHFVVRVRQSQVQTTLP
jgi:hypothetical protein